MHTAKLSDDLLNRLKTHTVVLLPKQGELYRRFGNKILDFEGWGIDCSCGDVPELSEGELMAVYFPKDLSNKNAYDDPEDDQNIREAAISFFNELREKGELFQLQ